MNKSYNYISIEEPSIPVVAGSDFGLPVAQLIDQGDDLHIASEGIGEVVQTKDMFLPQFSLRLFEGVFYHDAVINNQDAKGNELLGSCIFLKANVKSYLKGDDRIIEGFDRSHNFKFDPHNEFLHKIPANNPLHFIHFSYHPNFLDQVLPQNEGWADNLREQIHLKRRVAGEQAKPLSHGQERALQNIFDCPLEGKFGEMMVEASFAQLLLLQMHAHFNQCSLQLYNVIDKKDLDMLHALKEHLATTFLDNHTIIGLAKHFGTNSNKLMAQFKKNYGKSIFEHLTDLRMDHAGRLLRDENKAVIEVASILGYKNPNHFSTAFKRKYGIAPSAYRLVA